ncbi:polymorphic toxin type 27 domain-containing protein [Streptomyces parvus]|uniref:polymorphic toxin type 27 domain-containing protein n=1 Tax=Streptomyces parvus TaxID=66428 RepID=UPI00333472FB
MAKYLRNDPSDEGYDPNRPRDPGAHTYNGPDYADREPGGPVWMTNVMGAIGDRDTTLSITLDGMPNSSGRKANWSSPEDIVDAFQTAAQNGAPFNTSREENYPRCGHGTAWEMSEVAYAVRNYDGAAAWGDPDDERPGRPWEEIKWYTRDEEGDTRKSSCPSRTFPRYNQTCRIYRHI